MWATTRKLIEQEFESHWSANGGGVPVAWENAPFSQPSSQDWVAVHVRFGEGIQASLGSNPLERQPGLLIIQLFTKKNVGTRTISRRAGIVADGMKFKQLQENAVVVHTYAPSMIFTAEREDVMQVNVQIPFRAHEVQLLAYTGMILPDQLDDPHLFTIVNVGGDVGVIEITSDLAEAPELESFVVVDQNDDRFKVTLNTSLGITTTEVNPTTDAVTQEAGLVFVDQGGEYWALSAFTDLGVTTLQTVKI